MDSYCRGGAIVIRLLSEQVAPVDCGFICHPGPINTKEWKTIVKPSSWHLADQDDFMKDDQIAALVQLSEAKAKESVIMQHKLHPGEFRLCRLLIGRNNPWIRIEAQRESWSQQGGIYRGQGDCGILLSNASGCSSATMTRTRDTRLLEVGFAVCIAIGY